MSDDVLKTSNDHLRDRIAAAVERGISDSGPGDFGVVADAVIAELGLHPAESLDRRFIRWVTAWRNNPEMGLAEDE